MEEALKKYPLHTPEVARMLGLHSTGQDLPASHSVSHGDLPVANLPVAADQPISGSANQPEHKHPEHENHGHSEHALVDEKPAPKPYLKIAKMTLPYAAVFVVGLFLYYFFFSTVNFGSVLTSSPSGAATQESAAEQLQKEDMAGYQAWIKTFYYYVSDAKVLDPEADNSGNGLSNFQKYLLNLNPKSYDTLGLGMPDSQTIAMGINPLTGAALTDAQKSIIAKYVDMEVVNNRLALDGLRRPPAVAGVSAGTAVVTRGFSDSNPQVFTSNPAQTAPLDSAANLNSGLRNEANQVDVNTDIPGRLEIPALKINVPIIWSKNPKDFDKNLQSGVIHYPGTALPGQIGTIYIAGHSSNFSWAKGQYNQVFAHLGDLPDNASIKITVVQKSGKDAIFHYVVTHKKQYLPTDQEQFKNTGKSVVAISTCWPVGSTAKRLVAFGELTQVVK